MDAVITDLLDRYETELFWSGAKQDLVALDSDSEARDFYDAELDAWESAVGDGLEYEELFFTRCC